MEYFSAFFLGNLAFVQVLFILAGYLKPQGYCDPILTIKGGYIVNCKGADHICCHGCLTNDMLSMLMTA